MSDETSSLTDESSPPPRAWSALVDLDKPRELPADVVDEDDAAPDSGPVDLDDARGLTAVPSDTSPSDPISISEDLFDFDSVFPEYADQPAPAAPPAVVPGTVQRLRRWVFFAALLTVWFPAAAAGVGLYEWWRNAADPTLPLFGVVVFVIAAITVGLLLAMSEQKPWLSALAIAVLTATFAAMTATAAWHWAYAIGWLSP